MLPPNYEKLMTTRMNPRFPKKAALLALFVFIFILSLNSLSSSNSVDTSQSAILQSDIPQPENKEPRIAIVTFTTHETSYTQLSLKNKDLYAKQHNYSLFVDYETNEPRGTMWHKFVMLETVMAAGNHDWIWWIDFDTLITNTSIKISDIISESLDNQTRPNEIDFLLTADCFQLNAGSMLVRSKPSSLDFLDRVRAYGDSHPKMNEQDCIRDVVNNNKHNEKEQTLWIPQWKMNAFPEEIKCYDESHRGWERGMFAIHFAGAWAHVEKDDPTGFLMRKYEQQII